MFEPNIPVSILLFQTRALILQWMPPQAKYKVLHRIGKFVEGTFMEELKIRELFTHDKNNHFF